MKRTPLLAAMAVTLAVSSLHPADAAVKKPKPIKGSYTVTLLPDPSAEALDVEHAKFGGGCTTQNPQSKSDHKVTIPAAGTLDILLDGTLGNGAPAAAGDWDMYLRDASGAVVNSSNGTTAAEEIEQPVKAKTSFTIEVCNLAGQPNGKVSYTFTYK